MNDFHRSVTEHRLLAKSEFHTPSLPFIGKTFRARDIVRRCALTYQQKRHDDLKGVDP
jgi:hypothetical protein